MIKFEVRAMYNSSRFINNLVLSSGSFTLIKNVLGFAPALLITRLQRDTERIENRLG